MKDMDNLDLLVLEGDEILKTLLKKAYERGAADMYARIVNAAAAVGPIAASPPNVDGPGAEEVLLARKPAKKAVGRASSTAPQSSSDRAPRGALDRALKKVLSEHPGLKIKDCEELVRKIDPRISIASVGNTLRRLRGSKYYSEGGRWFLM